MMLNKIVIINLTLLITHQIDAAYWHEWEMFALPGGIQFFNILNIAISLLVLSCFATVIQRKRAGFTASLVIAGISALIFPIHAGFALTGYTQFHLPVSIFIIGSSFFMSIAQTIFTFKARHEFDVFNARQYQPDIQNYLI
jgi:hypothetical protein